MKTYTFEATIKKHEGKDATYIEIPFDIEKEFGAKRVKVKATFDGESYRGSIVRMGLPCYMLGVTKEMRNKIGKTYGDTIRVVIEKDEEERIVILPTQFEEMLHESKNAYAFYESLSYSQKRKYMQWLTTAKKEETRQKRMVEALAKLENNIKM